MRQACIGGQRACPSEDCGGVAGFTQLLEAMEDPDRGANDRDAGWIGRTFDPEDFSLSAVNGKLQEVR
ncbi:MAG: IS1096 element passenger TnpR family protein [Acidimicrobiales bacterium]